MQPTGSILWPVFWELHNWGTTESSVLGPGLGGACLSPTPPGLLLEPPPSQPHPSGQARPDWTHVPHQGARTSEPRCGRTQAPFLGLHGPFPRGRSGALGALEPIYLNLPGSWAEALEVRILHARQAHRLSGRHFVKEGQDPHSVACFVTEIPRHVVHGPPFVLSPWAPQILGMGAQLYMLWGLAVCLLRVCSLKTRM